MRWKGSYTVEAAFVIPIVLGVVFVLLYALFWVHDQCVLQANIQNGLIQYSDTGEELPTNEEAHFAAKSLDGECDGNSNFPQKDGVARAGKVGICMAE